jgi:hypothetical protein
MVKHLKLGFGERFLDELTRADVDAYVAARIGNEGPFRKFRKGIGRRAPELEVSTLSQIDVMHANSTNSSRLGLP